MQPDLLQQLKDIHMPAAPAWWPPAPGWWLLGAMMLAAAIMAVRFGNRYRRRRLPIKRARRLYQDLYERLCAGDIAAQAYVHESNELLKRLLIHGLHVQEARPASDDAWLQLLDERYGSPAFSNGPGRILGNQRFQRDPAIQVAPLHALLARFLARVRP